MSSVSNGPVETILKAAMTLFARHGFQKTSMADIAREAGIARATLYLRFADKRSLFETLAGSVVETALAGAEAAWSDKASLADNLAATILAKDLGFFRLLTGTPHGAELLSLDAELTRSHAVRMDAAFTSLMVRRAEHLTAEGADLTAFGGAAGFAAFFATAAAGLKHECRTEADYLEAVHRLACVAAAALK